VLHPKPLRYSGFILDNALDPGQQWLTALAPGPVGGEVADPTGGLDHPTSRQGNRWSGDFFVTRRDVSVTARFRLRMCCQFSWQPAVFLISTLCLGLGFEQTSHIRVQGIWLLATPLASEQAKWYSSSDVCQRGLLWK
jgi:hypothetical protein